MSGKHETRCLLNLIERFSNDCRKKQNQSNYSDQSQQERTLSVFLATIDSEVDERNEGTLHDAYSKEYASNGVQSWTPLPVNKSLEMVFFSRR